MNRSVLRDLSALVAGLVFGAGLTVSGMTRPQKVLGFLDVFGRWDASLMFVMIGAIAVHLIAYRLIRGRNAPLFAAKFAIPTRRDLDAKLLIGAALFGVGWGLGGYCPGPGIVSLPAGGAGAAVFVCAMLTGMFGTGKLEALLARSKQVKQASAQSSVAPNASLQTRASACCRAEVTAELVAPPSLPPT
jgi:uncharacterized membrane protein YedE/YeeE